MLCHFCTLCLVFPPCDCPDQFRPVSNLSSCVFGLLCFLLFSLLTCVQLVITPCVFKRLSSPLSGCYVLPTSDQCSFCSQYFLCLYFVFVFSFYLLSSLTLTDPVCLVCFCCLPLCFLLFWTSDLSITAHVIHLWAFSSSPSPPACLHSGPWPFAKLWQFFLSAPNQMGPYN